MIAPVYEQLSHDFPDVRFYKVDIDKDQVSRSVAASNVSAVVRRSMSTHSESARCKDSLQLLRQADQARNCSSLRLPPVCVRRSGRTPYRLTTYA